MHLYESLRAGLEGRINILNSSLANFRNWLGAFDGP